MPVRTVSTRGRVTLPTGIRRGRGLNPGDRFEFKVVGTQLLLVPVEKKSLAGLYGLCEGEGLSRALRQEQARELEEDFGDG